MQESTPTFRDLWSILHGERLRFIGALLALLGAAGVAYLVPLIPQAVIDGVLSVPTENTSWITLNVVELLGGREWLTQNLWLPMIVIAGITLVAGGLIYIRQRLSATAAQYTIRRLRNRVYDHVQKLPCKRIDSLDSGDLLQRCTSDVDTLQMFLQSQAVEIGRAAVMLLVPLPLMFAMDWRMAVAAIWAQPFSVLFTLYFFKKVRRFFRDKDEEEARLTSSVKENLEGIRMVRAFNRQTHEIDRFNQFNERHRERDRLLYYVLSKFWSLSDLVVFVQQASVIFVGAWLLSNQRIEVGEFYFFFAATGMFLWPVRMMGRLLAEAGKATVAIERIESILSHPLEEDPSNPAETTSGDKGVAHIQFRNASLAYEENSPVLHDISFDIRKGEIVAFVGPSGAGKTSIANILLRFNDVSSGEVLLDGVPLTQRTHASVRKRIAAVMQQPFLFARSIRDNLALGVSKADQESITIATQMAHIHSSITAFDHGYDTRVGERGVRLSGGQRQRISIAQAILQDPEILILDDALSAVDTRTEQGILEGIRARRGRHTTLIFAHRLSTLREADRIFVIEHGRITQEGDHDSLRSTPGLYQRLWNIQSPPENLGEEASNE